MAQQESRNLRWWWMALGWMTALCVPVSNAWALPAEDFVPLAPGDFWTYDEGGGVESTDTVLAVTGFQNGVVTTILETTGGGLDGLRRELTVGPNGFQLHRVDDAPALVIGLAPAYTILNADFQVGDEIMNSGTATVQQQGQSTTMPPYAGLARVDRFEQIQVPAGSFPTYVVTTTINAGDIATDNVWLAEGVGVVREERNDGSGLVTRELIATNLPEPARAAATLAVLVAMGSIGSSGSCSRSQ